NRWYNPSEYADHRKIVGFGKDFSRKSIVPNLLLIPAEKRKWLIFFSLFRCKIYGCHAHSLWQVFYIRKPNFTQNIVQLLSKREIFCRFRQISICFSIFREEFSHQWHKGFHIKIIPLFERKFGWNRCFQNHKNPIRFQYT